MPMLVQNQHDGPTVFRDDSSPGKEEYKWAGKGDRNGGDVLEVPDSVANNVSFRASLRKGVLREVSDEGEAREVLDRQTHQMNVGDGLDAARQAIGGDVIIVEEDDEPLVVLSDKDRPDLFAPPETQ